MKEEQIFDLKNEEINPKKNDEALPLKNIINEEKQNIDKNINQENQNNSIRNIDNNKCILDIDYLHELVQLPYNITFTNSNEGIFNKNSNRIPKKRKKFTRGKKYKLKTCHLCKMKEEQKNTFKKCYYCISAFCPKCEHRLNENSGIDDENENYVQSTYIWKCFKCKNLCFCNKCQKTAKSKNNSLINNKEKNSSITINNNFLLQRKRQLSNKKNKYNSILNTNNLTNNNDKIVPIELPFSNTQNNFLNDLYTSKIQNATKVIINDDLIYEIHEDNPYLNQATNKTTLSSLENTITNSEEQLLNLENIDIANQKELYFLIQIKKACENYPSSQNNLNIQYDNQQERICFICQNVYVNLNEFLLFSNKHDIIKYIDYIFKFKNKELCYNSEFFYDNEKRFNALDINNYLKDWKFYKDKIICKLCFMKLINMKDLFDYLKLVCSDYEYIENLNINNDKSKKIGNRKLSISKKKVMHKKAKKYNKNVHYLKENNSLIIYKKALNNKNIKKNTTSIKKNELNNQNNENAQLDPQSTNSNDQKENSQNTLNNLKTQETILSPKFDYKLCQNECLLKFKIPPCITNKTYIIFKLYYSDFINKMDQVTQRLFKINTLIKENYKINTDILENEFFILSEDVKNDMNILNNYSITVSNNLNSLYFYSDSLRRRCIDNEELNKLDICIEKIKEEIQNFNIIYNNFQMISSKINYLFIRQFQEFNNRKNNINPLFLSFTDFDFRFFNYNLNN